MPDLVPVHRSLANIARFLKIKDAESLTDQEKLLLTIVAMFKGLLDNTHSGDVVSLAVYRAVDLLKGLVPEDEVWEITASLVDALRSPHPMDSMF